ncbi:flagellar hook-associated protein 3 [Opitutus terrae]|uniref:Flagellar hook-associated protein 3 n=1 Tax=Opitutus terrae (strain DSM 11246 / JCM 15787 / PB90-1) TaxID=452637 RepID=B1ZR13_OPITP|nr:flagellar hook-associated protein 3 [Opitutus terrae]ACB73680.1 flagellar hook-associated protein 3 [Opitutus terrae PB90-1]
MRIASNTASEVMLRQIQQLSANQSKLQQQVGSGRRITNPEDDPAAVGRVLTLQSEQRRLAQYEANANRALTLSQTAYSGLKGLKQISDRANELATLGTGAMSSDQMNAYAIEVSQMVEQALQHANSQSGNDYVFAGTDVSNKPFEINTTTGLVEYGGNSDGAPIQLSEATTVVATTSGSTNEDIADMLNALISLRDALASGDPDQVRATQPALQVGENTVIGAMADVGGIQTRIEAAKSQQADGATNLESRVSDESSLDLPTAIVKLTQLQTAYEAALASTTKVMNLSLLDYIR